MTRSVFAWLRARHRGTKFLVLIVAAWAPWLLPDRPLAAGALMALAAGVFLAATSGSTAAISVAPPEVPHAGE